MSWGLVEICLYFPIFGTLKVCQLIQANYFSVSPEVRQTVPTCPGVATAFVPLFLHLLCPAINRRELFRLPAKSYTIDRPARAQIDLQVRGLQMIEEGRNLYIFFCLLMNTQFFLSRRAQVPEQVIPPPPTHTPFPFQWSHLCFLGKISLVYRCVYLFISLLILSAYLLYRNGYLNLYKLATSSMPIKRKNECIDKLCCYCAMITTEILLAYLKGKVLYIYILLLYSGTCGFKAISHPHTDNTEPYKLLALCRAFLEEVMVGTWQEQNKQAWQIMASDQNHVRTNEKV